MTPAHPDDPLFLAQLLCTRLCHDLSGPVGALANGVELIGGDPDMADAESLDLLAGSAAAAAIRLRVLRAAFGRPGGMETGELPDLLAGWAGGRVRVTVPSPALLALLEPAALQVFVNMALTVLDGTLAPVALTLAIDAPPPGGRLNVSAEAEGRGPREVATLAAALSGAAAADLGPRSAQAWLTGALARGGGGAATLVPTAAGVRLDVVLAAR